MGEKQFLPLELNKQIENLIYDLFAHLENIEVMNICQVFHTAIYPCSTSDSLLNMLSNYYH